MIAGIRALAFAVFLVIWWTAAQLAGPNVVPTPWATAEAGLDMVRRGEVFPALKSTVFIYLGGYLIGILVGLPLGLLMGGFRTLGRGLDVYVNALMATPRVAFIPLIIVALGLGFKAKITIVALGAVMPIIINTYAGVRNADGELVEMARSVGATRLQIFRRILLPGSLPFIVVGLRLGATIGLINAVVAELYTAVSGLGGLLAVYGSTFQMAPYFVVVLMLAALGTIISQALKVLETRTERWRYDGN